MAQLTMYTIAWICAIGTELVAAKQFLDETHDAADQLPANDDNAYVLGKVGKHNVVIAALPHGQYGLVSAAIVARDMARSFPNLRFALMVGIGGGAPSQRHDIRLGDIVVSSPDSGVGGVLQYDFGKTIQDESFKVTGHLNQSPQCLLRAIPLLEADYESDGNGIDTTIARILETKPHLRAKYRKPESGTDRLFSSVYKHAGGKDQDCTAMCDATHLVKRPERSVEEGSPTTHYGTIASANQLMKDANLRDKLSAENNVLCFEMEAAGLMNQFPCIVVRGICDYSDTHKNKVWQGYAAMVAAAYAKDMLRKVAPNKIEAERMLADVLSDVEIRLDHINSEVKTTHTELRSIRMDKHSNDIIQWLAPPDISSNFNKAIKTRHPGSGCKLLESRAYTTWKKGDNPFLWLHGITGCGKTILASTVIEDLKSQSNYQVPSQTLLYFYFDFTDSRKRLFESTLRSLICQTYGWNENAQKHLALLHSSCDNGKDQPDFDVLQKTLAIMLCELEGAWIVIDALDECTRRSELLSWIGRIAQDSSAFANVHLLVTSQPEHDIERAIRRHAHDEQMIEIREDLLEADIRNYVRARVREHEGLSRWRGHREIQDEIEASVLKNAKGMFRWASCQIDSLEDCLERKTLRKVLQDLPRTLDETYKRILANIPPVHMDHTRRLLQFLTYSQRPLRLEEAVDAIVVDIGDNVAQDHRFDPRNRLPIPREVTRCCSGLVVLVSKQGESDEQQIVEEIQLAHSSVKDYLLSGRLDEELAPHLEELQARDCIARVCLSYLLESKVHDGVQDDLRKHFPLARYSAEYWMSHATIVERARAHACSLSLQLFADASQVKNWCRLCNPDHPLQDPPKACDPASSLYYASLGGLCYCAQKMVDGGADVNAQGGRYGNALQAASWEGQEKVAQLLLDHGANANAQGGHFGCAIYAASEKGHKGITQLLLDYQADVNAQGGHYGSSLQVASWKGHKEVVRLLLTRGANVNAQGGHYGSALYLAWREGHKEIAQLLLEYRADVNAQGGRYGNALQTASWEGQEKVAQLLLDHGANANAQGGHFGCAIYAASEKGHKGITQLLLDYQADVNAQGGHYGSSLQVASWKGHKEVVRLLLTRGANVNAQGGRYGSALCLAKKERHKEIAQILLDHGAK